MMDFSALVLAPAMAVFGKPVLVTPATSRPDAPVFQARGVFAQKIVQVQTEEGTLSTVQPTLGIRLSEWPVEPSQGDRFVLDGVTWFIWDTQPDGQGGMDLVIKHSDPPASELAP